MRVFVAGATGAVGSRLTRLLVSSGRSVVGLTRTATKAEAIERARTEVSVADAAAATAIAVERVAPGIYNVVDDEPAPVREWLPALAAMLGAKPPRHVPKWLARIAAGEHLVMLMTEARAGSNVKAKRHLGWQPEHASWRRGFTEVLEVRTP